VPDSITSTHTGSIGNLSAPPPNSNTWRVTTAAATPRGAKSPTDTGVRFGIVEWSLTALTAIIWGSSFLLIAIVIDDMASSVVPLARVVLGAAVLAVMPGARRLLPRHEWPRLIFLGLVFMAVPFLLYPLAEETTSSAVAGMINGALPISTVAVAAILARKVPHLAQVIAVITGTIGILLISYGSVASAGSADRRGVLLLVAAILCYAVGVNLVTPLQRRYGSLPVLLHVMVFATLWTLPSGIEGLAQSNFTWSSVSALVILGTVSTGGSFAVFGVLLRRTGPVRGMIGVFFTPIVATVLGVTLRSEAISVLAVIGMLIVITGAVLTSRPAPPVRPPIPQQ
jgi:drug/metabolite transporter (DMT)-like permease